MAREQPDRGRIEAGFAHLGIGNKADIQRQSDKHSPRVDDQLAHEVESLVDGAPVEAHSAEHLMQEPTVEGEPQIDPAERLGDDEDPGIGVSQATADARAELARHLDLSAFPGDRQALLDGAERNHAPEAVLARLRALPADRDFANVQQVWSTLGGDTEETHTRTRD